MNSCLDISVLAAVFRCASSTLPVSYRMDQDESMGTILRWETGSVLLGALNRSSRMRICCQMRGFSLFSLSLVILIKVFSLTAD